MLNLNVYREVKAWKKPLHASKTYLAKSYLKLLPQIEIIAITGSVGKTLTQNAIVSILSQKFKTITPDENLDPTFRIPQTILAAKPWHQKLVLEYGVEHPSDMDHYLEIVKPKIAVVTKISPTHIRYLKNVEGVFAEKVKLVEALDKEGCAVLNADDPLVVKMAEMTRARVIWYGQKAPTFTHPRGEHRGNLAHPAGVANGIVKISHFTQSLRGSKFRLHANGEHATVSWKVVGKHQLTSAYAAATIGTISGLTLKQIAKGLSQTKAPQHRLNAISTKNTSIIDDSYNSSPAAAAASLVTLQDLGKHKKKIAVFGEMKDLGSLSESAHASLGQKVAKSNVNFLVTVGRVAELIAASAKITGFSGKIYKATNPKDATKFIKKIVSPKALILVKGSHHAHLERIVYALLGRETKVECYHCGILK